MFGLASNEGGKLKKPFSMLREKGEVKPQSRKFYLQFCEDKFQNQMNLPLKFICFE